ncbi:MAG: apolipoprotein N-acyltransferase [Alphaproteobacteria bacterium]|nr:MAG: apolipoprotein N-acyltransferase [Alphaproteobacteria bacterium]
MFRRYLALSRGGGGSGQPGLAGITHLIWPESAMPFLLAESTAALEAIAEMLPDDAYLLTGQARAQAALRSDGALVRQKIYNSLLVLDGKARVLAHYDKQHLVPFGEYLPFQEALEAAGLEQLTRVRGGFTPGERRPFVTPKGTPPFSPLICYEIIFPEAVAARARQPRWMLNVTNDAWFGATIGPYQHFHQARVRAVEQGLPLVRAANTGISAVVDAYGRIVASLPLGRGGVIDAELPKMTFRTPYARWGWRIEAAVAFLIAAAALIWRRRTICP